MAITYHAGRRIQGGLTTTTNVSTSSTGSTGNATNNGSGFTATTGLIGAGMSQASGNYLMTNEPALGSEWSFNFWCKPQAASGNDYFMQLSNDSGSIQSGFYMYNHSSQGLRMSVYDSTGVELGKDASSQAMWLAMTNGSWNMITMVWDNSAKQLRTYKNGVLYGTSKVFTHGSAGNMASCNKDWYMLNYNAGTGTDYASRTTNLDEWSWWSGTLSQADITALYNSGTGIKASDITGTNRTKLMVYYDFQDSPNGTLTNQAPTTTTYTVQDTKPLNTPVAKATGGTITTNGTKNVHTFTSGGTFTPVSAFNVEYLVVAGGGSGAVNNGGGGAGGYRTATGLGVTSQAYTITVGSGGTGSGYTGNRGNSGGNSVFSTITSTGGGGGGCESSGQIIGGNGGSGGGGGHTSGSAGGTSSPVTSPVQGYAGGSSGNTQVGGGGGGSSVVGSNGSGSTAGNGGNGTANSITGSSVTYAAGGGGGDVSSGSTGGSNGIGGDGSGQNGTGTAGDTNTGSGGGGSTGGSGNSGNGGSGIVIISYEGNISNVESGSRYEETNTRKIYYKDDVDWKELESVEATNYRSESWFEQLSGETP